jgi:hypothetical protein
VKRNYRIVGYAGKVGDGRDNGRLALQCQSDAAQAKAEFEKLMNRDWSQVELLVIFIDGMRFGSHHALKRGGLDAQGNKRAQRRVGASENTGGGENVLAHSRDHGVRRSEAHCKFR